MNALNSTRMKLTPKYGGPGALPAGQRVPFAATKAALDAFNAKHGDVHPFRKHRPQFVAPIAVTVADKKRTDRLAKIRGFFQQPSVLAGGQGISQECATQRQSAGIDLAPPLSDTGIPSPVAAPTLTTGQFKAEVRSQSSEVSR